MMSDDSRSLFVNNSGRKSTTPPKLGSSRVKSPLPAPAAFRGSCMSAAAKRYKVSQDIVSYSYLRVNQLTFIFSIFGGYSTSGKWILSLPFGKCYIYFTSPRMSTEIFNTEK